MENPGLVAPVTAVYQYDSYSDPLAATLTTDGIQVTMPGTYTGGITLTTDVADPPANSETYVLKSMTIRKAGTAPAGVGQQLPHDFEVALVHQLVGTGGSLQSGAYWVNMILPVSIRPTQGYDLINNLIGGAPLPTTFGSTGSVLVADAASLALDQVLNGSKFLNYWGTLPVSCGTTVPTRMMFKLNTIGTNQVVANMLNEALANVGIQPAVPSPANAWLIGTCLAGASCTTLEAANLQSQLTSAQQVQSQAVTEVRGRKALLDEELSALMANGEGAFTMAVSARDDLRTASEEMATITQTVNQLQSFIAANQSMVWDSNQPVASAINVPLPSSGNATSNLSNIVNATNVTSSLIEIGSMSSFADCSILGQSPIDIDSSRVIDAASISLDSGEPLRFRYTTMLQTDGTVSSNMLQVSNHRHYLHVSAGRQSVHKVGPLGAIISNGLLQSVSYIDVHVPGEHAIDGKVSPVELHIVHMAGKSKPAVAVAVRLEVDDVGDKNQWIDDIVSSMPMEHATHEVGIKPLALLHTVFDEEATDRYLRYDGSLTTSPCSSAQWFVLEEPGHISQQQLLALQHALPAAGIPHQRFDPSVVFRGVENIYTQIGLASEGERPAKSQQGRLRRTRRVQI